MSASAIAAGELRRLSREKLDGGSGYTDVDRTSDPAKYVRRLDSVSASPLWQAIKRRTYALLDLHEGDHVLDVGCGTGDDVRAMARLVGDRGRAVGVDSSATMVAEAQRRGAGTAMRVEFYQGEACQLDFPDTCFDACRAERVLQHLDDPRQALGEMVRVARSGARLVAVDPDYGTLSILGGDPAVTRRVLDHRRDHFRSGRIGGQLPGLFRAAGLAGVTVSVMTLASTTVGAGEEPSPAHKYAADAQAAGVISAVEGEAWLADLAAAAASGRYRHAVALFVVGGRKP